MKPFNYKKFYFDKIMKKTALLILFLSLLIFACKNDNKQESKQMVLEKNYDWLLGKWERDNNDSIKQTFEIWTKTDATYNGHGFILEQKDTVWEELMTFKEKNGVWELSVKTPGQNDAVTFKETSYTDSTFVVENIKHDFPKKIKYWKQNNILNAQVSSDEATIDFKFKPVL